MFKLSKEIEKYEGIPPYASELYGIYQPLLGWQSKLTMGWLKKVRHFVDPLTQRVLDANIIPTPTEIGHDPEGSLDDLHQWREGYRALPIGPGTLKSPYKVIIAKQLNSQFLQAALQEIQDYVDKHDGKLPKGEEWRKIFSDDLINYFLRRANDAYQQRLTSSEIPALAAVSVTPVVTGPMFLSKTPPLDLAAISVRPAVTGASASSTRDLLLAMQYESQVAAMVKACLNSQGGLKPSNLNELFVVTTPLSLEDIFRPTDPLANIDPTDTDFALSPVGVVHVFRQFFFDLGTFLGEPVEHVWLAPGTTIELVEVSTRRTLVERTMEESTEMITRTERAETQKDELSDATKNENENSVKFGVSQTNNVNLYVYSGSVSATLDLANSRKEAQEQSHKNTREISEKLATEIKQSYKTTFRTVTETTDLRSRRYVLQNPRPDLVNYELRRKMRRVGVQLQNLGTRLCWIFFIDDPSAQLGLSELVFLDDTTDLDSLKEPAKIPDPAPIVKRYTVPFPYQPVLDYRNNNTRYEYQADNPPNVHDPENRPKNWPALLGREVGDNDPQIVIESWFKVTPPQSGYELVQDVRFMGSQGNKIAVPRDVKMFPDGTIHIVMQNVHFGGENQINLELDLVFNPTKDEINRVAVENAKAQTKYNEEKSDLLRKSFIDNVRKRIKAAHSIRPRPSWDLREEERTVVYRSLIKRLMLDTWEMSKTAVEQRQQEEINRVAHIRSEIIRSLFDVDSLLYFVAPEWWMPRKHQSQLKANPPLIDPASYSQLDKDGKLQPKPMALSDDNVVKWGSEKRDDNYKITEDSQPARMGSSLGWLLQLDGDNLRNAFLNAPWVKAVIPIRPGRERAALNWLKTVEGEGPWGAEYKGTDQEMAELRAKYNTKTPTIGQALENLAEKIEKENSDFKNVLAADQVFEHGFSHLKDGFAAVPFHGGIYNQWISVVPTDQIVAVEYKPMDLFSPEG